jgi:GR25 family glycosyltransferase involved in LPS biosynthesis
VVIVNGVDDPIVSEKLLVEVCAVGAVASITVTITVLVAVAVGVPLITPVDALMLNPVGNPVAVQPYGVVPPVAATVAL